MESPHFDIKKDCKIIIFCGFECFSKQKITLQPYFLSKRKRYSKKREKILLILFGGV